MFKKRIILAFFVISLLGTLGHFIYEWTNNNYIVGLFFPVSESIWEHLKLVFYPTLIYSAFEYFLWNEKPQNYISSVTKSVVEGMAFIVIVYYIYSGIIGRNIDGINIPLYYFAVIFMLYKKEKTIVSDKFLMGFFSIISISTLIILGVLFAVFSYNPPSLGIFIQPLPTV